MIYCLYLMNISYHLFYCKTLKIYCEKLKICSFHFIQIYLLSPTSNAQNFYKTFCDFQTRCVYSPSLKFYLNILGIPACFDMEINFFRFVINFLWWIVSSSREGSLCNITLELTKHLPILSEKSDLRNESMNLNNIDNHVKKN